MDPELGRTETETKTSPCRIMLYHVEWSQKNPYGFVVSSVEPHESLSASPPDPTQSTEKVIVSFVAVSGAAIAGVYNAGEMPETVMVHFDRDFVFDLANYTPASAEKGYLSAARYMSPELLSRFEPVARAQFKQVVTNRISQFLAVDSEKVEGKDPLVVRFTGERLTYLGRTETERKPFQYRVTLQHVERIPQNPYGLVVSAIEQNEALGESRFSKADQR
jgi:hypothetical protein